MMITVDQLYRMVKQYVYGFWSRIFFRKRSWFFDVEYYSIPYDQFKQLLQEYKKAVSSLQYVAEVWDCDDFSEFFAVWMKSRTKTNCCGMAIGLYNGGGHAWNICLVDENNQAKIVFVEPQSGDEVTVNDEYKLLAVIW